MQNHRSVVEVLWETQGTSLRQGEIFTPYYALSFLKVSADFAGTALVPPRAPTKGEIRVVNGGTLKYILETPLPENEWIVRDTQGRTYALPGSLIQMHPYFGALVVNEEARKQFLRKARVSFVDFDEDPNPLCREGPKLVARWDVSPKQFGPPLNLDWITTRRDSAKRCPSCNAAIANTHGYNLPCCGARVPIITEECVSDIRHETEKFRRERYYRATSPIYPKALCTEAPTREIAENLLRSRLHSYCVGDRWVVR